MEVMRRHGVNVLAVPLGAGLAFLCLEVIGVLFLAVALPITYPMRGRWHDLPIFSIAFGLGFTVSVGFFAIRTSGMFEGTAGPGAGVWFGVWFLFGLTLLGGGLWGHRVRAV